MTEEEAADAVVRQQLAQRPAEFFAEQLWGHVQAMREHARRVGRPVTRTELAVALQMVVAELVALELHGPMRGALVHAFACGLKQRVEARMEYEMKQALTERATLPLDCATLN